MGRIDTFKPKPLYGAWLMELAPSHNDPINELGWLWSKEKPATAYALARAVKSAEARRAGCRDKFDKQKFNSVALKLRNMLGYRGRLASIDMVNPGRGKRRGRRNPDPVAAALAAPTPLTAPAAPVAAAAAAAAPAKTNPSLSKRRAAARKRLIARYRKTHNTVFEKARWHGPGGKKLLSSRWKLQRMAHRAGVGHTRLVAKTKVSRKNPPAAWGKAMKARRGKWLKRRFGYNPGRKTSRRKGAKYVPTKGGYGMGPAMPWKKAKRYVRKSKQWWERSLGSANYHNFGMARVNPKRSSRTGRFVRRGRK